MVEECSALTNAKVLEHDYFTKKDIKEIKKAQKEANKGKGKDWRVVRCGNKISNEVNIKGFVKKEIKKVRKEKPQQKFTKWVIVNKNIK